MTHVRGDFEGDTYFPPFEEFFHCSMIVRDTQDFTIVHYAKDPRALLDLDPTGLRESDHHGSAMP